MSDPKKDAENFIEINYDSFTNTYEVKLMWWCTFAVRIKRFQLEALKRVVDRALKQKSTLRLKNEDV